MVAAPILKEWDDIEEMWGGFIFFKMAAKLARVKCRPSCQIKRGPRMYGRDVR